MKILFTFEDETTREVIVEGELLDMMALQLSYLYPPTDVPRDKFVAETIIAQWKQKLANVLTEKDRQDRAADLQQEIEDKLSPMETTP